MDKLACKIQVHVQLKLFHSGEELLKRITYHFKLCYKLDFASFFVSHLLNNALCQNLSQFLLLGIVCSLIA